MAIYLITFLLGLIVDSLDFKKYRNIRTIYIIWLFVFLCFSYTNGSDWRSYELEYQDGYQRYADIGSDMGFVFIMRALRFLISDFWLTLGILKAIYLWSCVKVFRLFTEKWITATVLMMPICLLFMIIDNPLRFMVAMFFFNFAMASVIERRNWQAVFLSLISLTCHSVTIVCLPFLFLLRTDFLSKVKTPYLIAIYIILLVVSNQVERMQELQAFGGLIMSTYFGREGILEHYSTEDPVSLINLGTLMYFAMFLIVLYSRKRIIKESGNNLFTLAILYFYIFIISHAIPVGHRIRIPMTFFCCLAFTFILNHKDILKYAIILLLFVSMAKTIYNGYTYIPYTNSIPYILTEHKPYNERFYYNINEYKLRTGKSLETD